jgi:2-C-methyl-D-erythritol 4-phosphate cytidylyltransferase
MNYGIVVAAGKSKRMGPLVDKAFFNLGNMPVLAYSLRAFERCPDIDGVILVVRKDRLEGAFAMARMYGFTKVKSVVVGAATRQGSVAAGLRALDNDAVIVAVHDGARPCVTPELISETVKSAKRYGSGVAAIPIGDTVKYVERGLKVAKTLDRSKLWAAQTPQTFKRKTLLDALEALTGKGETLSDEAQALELNDIPVHLVSASTSNVKITTPEDLALAAAILKV